MIEKFNSSNAVANFSVFTISSANIRTEYSRKYSASLSSCLITSNLIKRFVCNLSVRAVFMFFSVLYITYIGCIYENKSIYGLFFFLLIMFVDCLYVLVNRRGYDTYWFSWSITSYLIIMLICIHSEVEFHFMVNDVDCSSVRTNVTTYGNCYIINRDICGVIEDMVFFLVASVCFARWILPHHKSIPREEKYLQTFTFTIAAADTIKIGDYMYSKHIKERRTILAIQIAFSLSLIQFCFSLVAVRKKHLDLVGLRALKDVVLSTESWSLILVIFTQELPSLVARVFLLMSANDKLSDMLLFFAIKNFLLIILFAYRSYDLIRVEYQQRRLRLINQV